MKGRRPGPAHQGSEWTAVHPSGGRTSRCQMDTTASAASKANMIDTRAVQRLALLPHMSEWAFATLTWDANTI